MKTATETGKKRLWKLCQKFVRDQEISCGESVYQMDNVIENAYEFIENVCEIVGYSPREEEEGGEED